MTLVKYKQKRSFDKTPEPEGGKTKKGTLRFVIQKHDASHLHYDFRLEMEGVLKSWAVPKGPSMDPSVKHLALMVEDHPFDYRTFEGIIPKGNYGGGTVMVWDEGTYESFDSQGQGKSDQDKNLRHQLHAGKIKFILNGTKLKGAFALVKSHGRGENAWLLMKVRDEFASADDILLEDKSAVSGKRMDSIAGSPDHVYGEKPVKKASMKKAAVKRLPLKKAAAKQPITSKKKTERKIAPKLELKGQGVKAPFPSFKKPMLATLVDKPVDEAGWLYEVKWDGYRAVSFIHGKDSEIKSRNDKSFDKKFYPVLQAIKDWNIKAVIDGEIVVLNEKGISNFGALQNWRSEADGTLVYYVFDILWYDGKDLTSLTLTERRDILRGIVPSEGIIRFSENFESTATEFLALAKKMGMEGIIAKRADSTYRAGDRTTDWLKIKSNKRQEVVIGGFTRNDDSDKLFSALLVGVFENKKLVYTGKIGTGFTEKMQKDMMKEFSPLITKTIPFDAEPDVNKPSRFRPNPPHATATWLKPKLVCEVSFAEMTTDGVMRHPSFEGMRVDKKPTEVVLEKEMPVEDATNEEHVLSKKKVISGAKSERKTLLNPSEETQVKKIHGHEIKFTNLSKIYWPEDNLSKRDMLNYYYRAAPFLLPYLKDRPQSLNRFPNGIHGKSFYQKDVTGKVPDWVSTYLYHASNDPEDKHFLVVKNEDDILLMASMGCIELNPWSSTVDNPDNPDWCIIDLDPDVDKNSFDHVIQAAQATRKVLDALKVPAYCKTSGSTGLHIYIPLGGKYSYEQSKEFARVIAKLVNKELPSFTSIERTVSDRKGKLYIDFLQNRPQATLAAPYSLRPKIGATVSMPLHWEEVKKGLKMTDFTIFNAIQRMEKEGDIFSPVLGKGINLEKIVKEFK